MSETAAPSDEPETAGPSEDPETAPPSWGKAIVEALSPLWVGPTTLFAELGVIFRLVYQTARWGLRPPFRLHLFLESLEFIGVQSIFIVGLTGTFVGAVFGLQLGSALRPLGVQNQVGSIVGLALARELAPVFSALMITSRAGSAMATEIASMRVTNQIDALTTMSVNPIQYLVVPRVTAGTIAAPIMTLLFFCVGLIGAYTVGVYLMGLDGGIFMERFKWFVDASDVVQGLVKAAFFGATLTLIACRQGFYATGGAVGVGRATNRAVVQSAVAILVLDYFLTGIILGEGLF